MNRFGFFALSAVTLSGCAGLPPTTHPLFIARPAESPAPSAEAASVSVEMNNVLLTLPASTGSGCPGLAGDYVRRGGEVEVRLRQETGAAGCDHSRSFVTRIGPLPPGSYEVTVMLDGRPLISAQRAVIS